MGAEVVRVEPSTFALEQQVEAPLTSPVFRFGKKSASDARLVGDDDREETALVQSLDGLCCSWEEANLGGVVQIAGVLDDGAVPVEEDGAPASERRRAHEMRACSIARPMVANAGSGSVRG